jgi:hypothetical protein
MPCPISTDAACCVNVTPCRAICVTDPGSGEESGSVTACPRARARVVACARPAGPGSVPNR